MERPHAREDVRESLSLVLTKYEESRGPNVRKTGRDAIFTSAAAGLAIYAAIRGESELAGAAAAVATYFGIHTKVGIDNLYVQNLDQISIRSALAQDELQHGRAENSPFPE